LYRHPLPKVRLTTIRHYYLWHLLRILYNSIVFHKQRRVSAGGQPYYIVITTQSVHRVLQSIKIIITKRRKTTSDPVTITAASEYKIRVTHHDLDHSKLAITHTHTRTHTHTSIRLHKMYNMILYARTATVLYPFCSPKTATYTYYIGWVYYTCRRRIIFDRRQCTRHMK